jgi:hypothetical protein
MDPQCDDYWLFMDRIVEMYGRCGFDRERAWRWLNNMYWRGEFEPYARSTISYYPMIPRRQMLAVWRECDHPGMRFCCNEIPVYQYDDGAIRVDLFKDIVLPEQTDAWTEQHCNDAYKILAHVDQSDIEPVCLAGLMCQFVGSYELLAICREEGLDPPPFWRSFKPPPKGTNYQRFAQLASWFNTKISAGERVTNPQLIAEAESQFSIVGSAVDAVWSFAPKEWRKRGRPLGSRNRH